MANNLNASYPTQSKAPTAAYPYGSAQNITVSGDDTGTPWRAEIYDDILGFQQALLYAASIVPSGNPDQVGASQYLQAIEFLIATLAGQDTVTIDGDSLTFNIDGYPKIVAEDDGVSLRSGGAGASRNYLRFRDNAGTLQGYLGIPLDASQEFLFFNEVNDGLIGFYVQNTIGTSRKMLELHYDHVEAFNQLTLTRERVLTESDAQVRVLSADVDVTNSTTFVPVPQFELIMPAGSVFIIRGVLLISEFGGGNGGGRITLQGTGAQQTSGVVRYGSPNSTTVNNVSQNGSTLIALMPTGGASQGIQANVDLVIRNEAGVANTVSFAFAQHTADAVASSLKQYSYLEYKRVA